jgi:NAD(P)-dependent dehydrogenase (short-subunit alcohol dehydrogenase family)
MALRNRCADNGGTRGIGRGNALRLAKEGARGATANKNVAQNTLRQLQAAGAIALRWKRTSPLRNGPTRTR